MTVQLAVIGEALVDLVEQPNGDLRPHLGGSPYNVARALGRQEVPTTYASPLSVDRFGEELRSGLLESGVRLPSGPNRSERPTSLAVVAIGAGGQPTYAFYREGVADKDLAADRLLAALPADLTALHTGSLALTPDLLPVLREVLGALRARGVVLSCDLNLRPRAVPDASAYVRGIEEILPLFDLVKASDEDLRHLGRNGAPVDEARRLHEALPGRLVAVTLGAEGAALVNDAGHLRRPAFAARKVVDTIGAGDCFQAGLLRALGAAGLLTARRFATADEAALQPVLAHALATAALDVERAGCEPPTLAEVTAALARG